MNTAVAALFQAVAIVFLAQLAAPIRAQPVLGASRQPIDIPTPEFARHFNSTFRSRPCKQKPNNRARKLQGHKPTPVRANRMGEILRKMFTLAMEWDSRADNPAQGFHRRIEHARERFLNPE